MADHLLNYNPTSPPYSANSPQNGQDSEDEDDGRDVIIEKDKWTKFKVSFSNELVTRYLKVNGQYEAMLFVSNVVAEWGLRDRIKNPTEEKSMVTMYVDEVDDNWDFEALVSINKGKADRLTKSKSKSCLFNTPGRTGELVVHVKFFDIVAKPSHSLFDDLMKHVSKNSPQVTLVGHDGEVTVSLVWLTARSKVFEVMFEPEKNSQELQTLRVVIPDYSKDVLEQFVHFLRTDLLPEDEKDFLELMVLADKYDVPLLKEKTQSAAVEQAGDQITRELLEFFLKVNPGALVNILVSKFKKIKSSPFLEIEMKDPTFAEREVAEIKEEEPQGQQN